MAEKIEEILTHLKTLNEKAHPTKQVKIKEKIPTPPIQPTPVQSTPVQSTQVQSTQVRVKVPVSPVAFKMEVMKEQFNTFANSSAERFDYVEKQLLRLNGELNDIHKSIHKHGVGGHLRWIGKQIIEGKAPHAEKFFQDFESLAVGLDNTLESKLIKRIIYLEERIVDMTETQEKLVEALQVLSHIKEAETRSEPG